ncbi:MAG: Gfo/Idh/MocA family oxidoreductase [Promethearchaeota archaeon]|nr:MAG: Gfo/Idh/MocA family oxidoreductase [Candidatus Lokiarchaeota archaeon]
MNKSIKYALVGYGLNALGHKTELEGHPLLKGRAKLIAGYDPDPSAKKNLVNNEGIKVANSFDDLLDTPELDALLICSPPQYHARQAIVALEFGLHVYSEIPMAIQEKNLEKIINAEEGSGKKYQLGENYCFYPEVLFASHLASSGKIGPSVYAESEYLHDITYRWRENGKGDVGTPRIDSWYQNFDPLMYAHSIGPAQVALGGIEDPMPFIEVVSYANDIGGYKGEPICKPAKAFHVGLFRTSTGAIAKCANAYIFAREPSRIIIQIVGRTGTYECYDIDTPGRLFLAKGHKISRSKHRRGKIRSINKEKLAEIVPPVEGLYYGAQARIVHNWLSSIEQDEKPLLHSKIGANMCLAGIAASRSARSGGKPQKIKKLN